LPNSNTTKALREAIFKEQVALAMMDKLYCEFIVKMLHYQTGKCEPPTTSEFVAWRESVDRRIEFSRLRGLL
jgi:hypothetical protein